jgi:aryl carrier-like protein
MVAKLSEVVYEIIEKSIKEVKAKRAFLFKGLDSYQL